MSVKCICHMIGKARVHVIQQCGDVSFTAPELGVGPYDPCACALAGRGNGGIADYDNRLFGNDGIGQSVNGGQCCARVVGPIHGVVHIVSVGGLSILARLGLAVLVGQ